MCAGHTTLTVRSSISNNQSDSRRNAEGEQTEQTESWESQGAKWLAQFNLEQRSRE